MLYPNYINVKRSNISFRCCYGDRTIMTYDNFDSVVEDLIGAKIPEIRIEDYENDPIPYMEITSHNIIYIIAKINNVATIIHDVAFNEGEIVGFNAGDLTYVKSGDKFVASYNTEDENSDDEIDEDKIEINALQNIICELKKENLKLIKENKKFQELNKLFVNNVSELTKALDKFK